MLTFFIFCIIIQYYIYESFLFIYIFILYNNEINNILCFLFILFF